MKNKLQSIKLIFILLISLYGTSFLFSQDINKPIPYCIAETTVNMTNGSVTIYASDFDAGSFDDETFQSDLRFTFSDVNPSQDPEYDVTLNSSVHTFTESPNTTIEISMYVWDSLNNFDFCVVSLHFIEDVTSTGSVSGQFVYPTYTPPDSLFQPCDLGSDVNMRLENVFDTTLNMTFVSSGQGFAFNNLQSGTYKLKATTNNNNMDGLTTLDAVLVLKHILQIKPFINPTSFFAADVRKDNQINTLDIIQMRSMILGRIDSFPQNTSWRFGDALQEFEQNQNPLEIGLQEQVFFQSNQDAVVRDFIPIKIGDINNSQSCLFNEMNEPEEEPLDFVSTFSDNFSSRHLENTFSKRKNDDMVTFSINNFLFGQQQEICVPIVVENFTDVAGFQFPLSWDENVLSFDKVINPFGDELFAQQPNSEAGEVFIVWYNQAANELSVPNNTTVFEICFNVLDNSETTYLSFQSEYGFESGVYNLFEPIPYIFNNGEVDFGQGCVPYKQVSLGVFGATLDAKTFYNGEESGDEVLVNGETLIHFECEDVGEHEVLVTINFANGEIENCTTIVTVNDKLPPIAIVDSEIDITLNSDLLFLLDYNLIDDGSYDMCSELTYSVSPSTLDCDSPNPSFVTLTVVDASGNSNSAITKVNINYPSHPGNAMVCNDNVEVSVAPNTDFEVTADIILEGNITCSSYYQVELFDDINSPTPQSDNILDFSDAGNNYVAQVTDSETGNTCWGNIIVDGNNNGNFKFIMPEVNVNQYDEVCVSMTVENFYNVSAFQVPVKWDDEILNFKSIIVPDNSPLKPNLLSNVIDDELYVVWFEQSSASLSLPNASKIFDLCFDAIGNPGTSSPLTDESDRPDFITEVTDLEGQLINHDFVDGRINIQSAGCENNVSVSLGILGATVYADSFYSGEQPGDEILVNGEESISFYCDDVGSTEVLLTINHANGQTENCIVFVEVEDKLAPIAIVESDFTISLPNTLVYQLTPEMIDDGSFDNCNDLTYSISPSVIDCNSPNPTYVVLTVTDASGNSSSAFTKINIEYPNDISTSLTCNDNIQISVTANTEVEITADMILEGGPYCYSYYDVELYDDINSADPQPDEIINISDAGHTYIAIVTDPQSNLSCWSTIEIISIDCNTPLTLDDIQWPCDISLDICETYSYNATPQWLKSKGVDISCTEPQLNTISCQLVASTYEDQVFIINNDLTKIIRNWIVIDWRIYESGSNDGVFEYEQIIELNKITGQDFIVCDTKAWNTPIGDCDSGHTLEDIVEWPGDINLSTYAISLNSLRENTNVHPFDVEPRILNICSDYQLYFQDNIFNIDSSLVKVLRTWTLVNLLSGNEYTFIQILRINGVYLSGNICAFTENGQPIENVDVVNTFSTTETGCVELENVSFGTEIIPEKEDQWVTGLDLMDLITMYKAILGAETLTPYQLIAADINENGQVTTLDAVLLEKIIAGQNALSNVPVWKFVDAYYQFSNDVSINNVPQNYPSSVTFSSTNMYQSFVGMKMGDLHQSYVSNQVSDVYPNTFVSIKDKILNKGETYNIDIITNEKYDIEGIQLEFVINSENIEVLYISSDVLTDFSMADNVFISGNKMKINYNLSLDDLLEGKNLKVDAGSSVFSISIKAKNNSILNDEIDLNSDILNILKSKDSKQPYKLNIKWDDSISNNINTIVNNIDVFVYPQPAKDIVSVEFSDKSFTNVNYTITNIVGQKILSNKLNEKTIDVSGLSNGLYLIHFNNENGLKAVKKLIINK